jgi:hypothetical protein
MDLLSHGMCNLGRSESLSGNLFHDKIRGSLSAHKNVRNCVSISVIILSEIP